MKYVFISSTSTLIRKYLYFAFSFLALGILLFTYSCKPDDPDPSFFEVTTTEATSVMASTAQVEGQVTIHGNPEISARGVCWSTTTTPTVSDNKTTDGTGAGNFTSTLTGLNENTVYHARAYATANNEVVYGNEISFSTRSIEVYISGTDEYGRAVYWKNGEKVELTDGVSYVASGSSIFVSENDVYVSGYEGNYAKYWKNGQAVVLPSSTASGVPTGRSIFVSQNNIYVAGDGINPATGKYQAIYWKNGEGTLLTDGSNHAFAYSIFVSGTDVYVAGRELGSKAKYWKNGMAVSLSSSQSSSRSILVSGSDIYVAGSEYDGVKSVAKYWKNGLGVSLISNFESDAFSIFVSGSDVYVAGYEKIDGHFVAKYWKNGVPVSLTSGSNNYAQAVSISVLGNDVYVVGREDSSDGTSVAKYWKNGVAVSLTDGIYSGDATGIFVRLK
jgi:hypothetical protein